MLVTKTKLFEELPEHRLFRRLMYFDAALRKLPSFLPDPSGP